MKRGFFGPDAARMAHSFRQSIAPEAGTTAVWRKLVSATTGNDVIGQDAALHYVERTISAFFMVARGYLPDVSQKQTPAGQFMAGGFYAVTPEAPGEHDEFIWRGEKYALEGESSFARFTNNWVTYVTRSE